MAIIKSKKNNVWNLPVAGTGAQIGNYHFKQALGYNKQNITKTTTHILTALATLKKKVNKPKKSVLIEGGSELRDILFLYNFFKRGNACLDEDSKMFPYCKITNGCKLKPMPGYQLQKMLQKTLNFIQEPKWKKEHKNKVLAFNWLLVARKPDYLQLKFFKTWMSIDSINKKVSNELCKKLLDVSSERFNTIRGFWREIRNSYTHEGICNYDNFVVSNRKYGLNGFFCKKKNQKELRFNNDEKKLFNQNVDKQNFDDFKCASVDIMETVLTLYFFKVFGIDDTQIKNQTDHIDWHIKNINYYFNNLHMPKQKTIPTLKFRSCTQLKNRGYKKI